WLRRRFSDLPEAPVPKPRGAIEERYPILAFHVRGNERSFRFSVTMRKLGLDFRAIRRPTVAEGTERIRISLSLNVSRDNTESMAELVVSQWKEFLSRERTPGSEKRPSPLDC